MSSEPTRTAKPSLLRSMLAWGAHAYTALGLVAAAGIALLIVEGTEAAFRWAFLLMFVAVVIDATDGWFARAVDVKRVLPNFDGRRLDDIIDFITYTALPLLLVWRARLLPPGQEAWLLLPLVASAYGFCQVSAKTDDGFFLGFPSYWNIVAFYLYMLDTCLRGWPPILSAMIVVGLALLTLVPSRYLYPTQGQTLSRLTNLLGAVWAALILWIWRLWAVSPSSASGNRQLAIWLVVSLFFPVYYLLASWLISYRLWRKAAGAR